MIGEVALLSLGSNLGPREQQLLQAARDLGRVDGIHSVRQSSLYETEPVGVETARDFINACCVIETTLDPDGLLQRCKELERVAGREGGCIDRPLDIDIILFGERRIEGPRLVIPHPEYRRRRFVLVPLAELLPDLPLPPDGRTARDILSGGRCSGRVRTVSSRGAVPAGAIGTI